MYVKGFKQKKKIPIRIKTDWILPLMERSLDIPNDKCSKFILLNYRIWNKGTYLLTKKNLLHMVINCIVKMFWEFVE